MDGIEGEPSVTDGDRSVGGGSEQQSRCAGVRKERENTTGKRGKGGGRRMRHSFSERVEYECKRASKIDVAKCSYAATACEGCLCSVPLPFPLLRPPSPLLHRDTFPVCDPRFRLAALLRAPLVSRTTEKQSVGLTNNAPFLPLR